MKFKVYLDSNAIMPTKAHDTDAGFDLYTPIKIIIPPHSSACIDTGVHMMITPGYVGFIKSKSGLNVKDSILSEGVIDANYTGSIVAKLYNHSDREKIFEVGNKITQIVILPIPEVELEQVEIEEELGVTERGNCGFGSSGV